MRRHLIALALATIAASWSQPATAAGFAVLMTHTWEGIFTGSRLSAMGGADLACDDGPGALLVNPAPLMRGDGIGVAYDHVDYPLAEVSSNGEPNQDLDYLTTAVGVEWQGWRFSACLSDESLDNAVIRTAYQPEGTGTLDSRSRMALVGLARELAGHPQAERGPQWTIGVAYRSFSTETTSVTSDQVVNTGEGAATGTWDAGSTAAYRFVGDGHRASIAASIAWQNLTDGTFVNEEREMALPQAVRMGLTTGITVLSGQREWIRFVAAIARSDYSNTSFNKDYSQLGIEVTVWRVLALRAGSNDRFYGGGSSTWGAGLLLEHPRNWPLELAVDYGEIVPDNSLFNGAEIGMWSGRLRMDF